MTKLVKAEPGWAINRKGRRIDLANWNVVIDGGKVIGNVYQVLYSGSRKKWHANFTLCDSRSHAIERVVRLWAEKEPVANPLCKCGAPHDGWPGKDGGELCQMCWEAETSDAWWEMANNFPGAVCPVEVQND